LEELYISHNGIEKIEGIEKNTKLSILDLANNKIEKLENIHHLLALEEFWMNNNKISEWKEMNVLKYFPNLETVYFEQNPIANDPMYRKKIMFICPQIKKIDATLCRN